MKTKKERILNNIRNNKELMSNINNISYFDENDFYNNANRYIKAIKEGRVICNINKVSKSGMSRTIKFLECSGSYKTRFNYLNFWVFFKAMGYTEAKYNYFRVYGTGMDMIFHTNYNNIHNLQRLGFISKNQCSKLAQLTPTVI